MLPLSPRPLLPSRPNSTCGSIAANARGATRCAANVVNTGEAFGGAGEAFGEASISSCSAAASHSPAAASPAPQPHPSIDFQLVFDSILFSYRYSIGVQLIFESIYVLQIFYLCSIRFRIDRFSVDCQLIVNRFSNRSVFNQFSIDFQLIFVEKSTD